MSLTQGFKKFLATLKTTKRLWVAYSGGLDSHVLLHLLASARDQFDFSIQAIHINHSLSPNAQYWSQHCANVCKQLKIDFQKHIINAKAGIGESPEEKARLGRYQIFTQVLQHNDALLTAHHQDDQAETLLLQLVRGAGPKGLAAMPICKPLGLGFHYRPLLHFTRDELQQYAEENNLVWITDESNTNTQFARNYIREEILPLMKQRWPSVTATLSRSAFNCAEAQQLLHELAEIDYQQLIGTKPYTLSLAKLLLLSPSRQRHVLRFWFEQLGYPIPSHIKLHQIQRDMLHAAQDKTPSVEWGNVMLKRFQGELYLLPFSPLLERKHHLDWDFKQPLNLPGLGVLHAQACLGQGLVQGLPDITVRFRQGGESCRLPARNCSHTLKNLFNQWRIPSWERNKIPLIYSGNNLVAIVGYAIAEGYQAQSQEPGFELILDKNKAGNPPYG
jgi:tRNA(Ile)-lysidine synthase